MKAKTLIFIPWMNGKVLMDQSTLTLMGIHDPVLGIWLDWICPPGSLTVLGSIHLFRMT